MPSPTWRATHRMITLWLTKAEAADFKAACKRRNITISGALRQALAQIMKEN